MFSKTFNSIVAEYQKEYTQEGRALLQFKHLGRLGTELANFGSKISEILVGPCEEGMYNAEYIAAEKHRKKLRIDVAGE